MQGRVNKKEQESRSRTSATLNNFTFFLPAELSAPSVLSCHPSARPSLISSLHLLALGVSDFLYSAAQRVDVDAHRETVTAQKPSSSLSSLSPPPPPSLPFTSPPPPPSPPFTFSSFHSSLLLCPVLLPLLPSPPSPHPLSNSYLVMSCTPNFLRRNAVDNEAA
eukprot:765678-Hanusia_phi.AAC.3